MDLGKIMIGIALVVLSVGLLVSPSSAAVCDCSGTVGCWSTFSSADTTVTPSSPLERENPAGYLVPVCDNANHGSTP
jgi:hypothetical protein